MTTEKEVMERYALEMAKLKRADSGDAKFRPEPDALKTLAYEYRRIVSLILPESKLRGP